MNVDIIQTTLLKIVDVSDSNNNMITFRIKATAMSTSASCFFKFEDGFNGEGALKLSFFKTGIYLAKIISIKLINNQ